MVLNLLDLPLRAFFQKNSEREKILLEISKSNKTTILFEFQRLKKSLNEIKYCGGEREIIVSRELTKKFEENIGNNIDEALVFENKEVIGEITLIWNKNRWTKKKLIN